MMNQCLMMQPAAPSPGSSIAIIDSGSGAATSASASATGFMNTTGANFIIADIGGVSITENEGNGLMSTAFPKTQIVIAGIEKIKSAGMNANDVVGAQVEATNQASAQPVGKERKPAAERTSATASSEASPATPHRPNYFWPLATVMAAGVVAFIGGSVRNGK